MMRALLAIALTCALTAVGAASWGATAGDQPKRGGTLIYGISALMLGIDLRRGRHRLASPFEQRSEVPTDATVRSHTHVGSVV